MNDCVTQELGKYVPVPAVEEAEVPMQSFRSYEKNLVPIENWSSPTTLMLEDAVIIVPLWWN
jgi:hypothetical protein